MHSYATREQSVAVTGVDDLVVRSLADRQQADDDPDAATNPPPGLSSSTWSLFGLVWPSGRQLAARIAMHPVTAGERVLEVGCGLALASLVAHRRGADVTASDHHPLAERFLNENLLLNHLPAMKFRLGPWSDHPETGTSASGSASGSAATDTAGAAASSDGYHLVIGSDVLYDRDASVALAGYIGHHATSKSEAWIVDPDRSNRSGFNRGMADHGFIRTEERLDCAATEHEEAYRGRLMTYRRG